MRVPYFYPQRTYSLWFEFAFTIGPVRITLLQIKRLGHARKAGSLFTPPAAPTENTKRVFNRPLQGYREITQGANDKRAAN